MTLMPISYLSQLLKVTHQLRMLSKLDFATSKPVGNCLGIGFKGLGLTLFLVAFLYMTTQTIQELKRVIYQMVDYTFHITILLQWGIILPYQD
ncbi:unnamed protein product [Rhizophagus irregularis]|nr:unnamed protein product [Rhizophagus irregularis]